MRPAPAPKTFLTLLGLGLALARPAFSAEAGNLRQKLQDAWKPVSSYQCVYRALTGHEGARTETRMRYSYQRPGKIRMDIDEPRRGAVLIYNPAVSDKVSVKPFPRLPMVLHYELTNKRVTSDKGGTLDRSDLGHRIQTLSAELERAQNLREENPSLYVYDLQEEGKTYRRRVRLGWSGLPEKIETLDAQGGLVESFEWTDLKVNPALDAGLFTRF